MGRSKTILNRDAQWNEVSKNLCVKRSNNVFD